MLDRPKKRHKDYKRIVTRKRLDTSIYCEGLPYLVKFNGDEKGKGIDYDDGKVGICIEASGGSLTFVFVSGTFVHEEYNTKVVSISCKYLDSSKIEIIPYWSDTDVLKLIDSVKHDPDKYHGYNYWNEEVEIYDQDNVEKEKLNDNFRITIDGETYPLLIPKFDKDEQYEFNMDALQILEDKDLTCLIHIKRKHLDKWATHGDFKIKVLHNPDGFQMFHTLKTDDENMELKDTWFPGDILSNVKGIQIETSICKYHGKQVLNVFFDEPCPVTEDVKGETTKDVETEPEMVRFHIKDWDKIIDPDSSVNEYPLFVRDEHSNDHWIFNYDVLSKALCRKDVTFEISIKIKGHWAQAYCSCKADDVKVHVGGSTLTGRIPDKKDKYANEYANDAFVEFKASDWKEMDFALVNLRRNE
jgi:hypothetical protein